MMDKDRAGFRSDVLGVGDVETFAWVERPMGEWIAAFRLVPKDGRPVVAEVRVFPNEDRKRALGEWSHDEENVPLGGLTTTALRGVHVQPGLEAFPDVMHSWQRDHGLGTVNALLRERGYVAPKPKHPGRKGRTDTYYAEWARRYVRECARSRTPIKNLAVRHHLAPQSVTDLISEARRRVLLTAAPPGRAGGTLTEKAQELLKQADASRGRKKR